MLLLLMIVLFVIVRLFLGYMFESSFSSVFINVFILVLVSEIGKLMILSCSEVIVDFFFVIGYILKLLVFLSIVYLFGGL